MRTRASMLTASLLGALALLPSRVASAQGSEAHVDRNGVETPSGPTLSWSSLEPGWWHAITDALDAMRGLRGHRIPPAAARQVDLRALSAPARLRPRWQDLPPATQTSPRPLELRFGPVDGAPFRLEPIPLSTAYLRGESGELLGARLALPWIVP